MSKFLGLVLILDGWLSLFIVKDRRILWQLGRLVRVGIGIYFVLA
jgi:hypothetical protein